MTVKKYWLYIYEYIYYQTGVRITYHEDKQYTTLQSSRRRQHPWTQWNPSVTFGRWTPHLLSWPPSGVLLHPRIGQSGQQSHLCPYTTLLCPCRNLLYPAIITHAIKKSTVYRHYCVDCKMHIHYRLFFFLNASTKTGWRPTW